MATITQIEKGAAAGIWATANGMTAGLVATDSTGPYLCFYGKDMKFPKLCIFVGQDGKAKLQFPGPGGGPQGARQVNLEDLAHDLLDGAEAFQAAPPPNLGS